MVPNQIKTLKSLKSTGSMTISLLIFYLCYILILLWRFWHHVAGIYLLGYLNSLSYSLSAIISSLLNQNKKFCNCKGREESLSKCFQSSRYIPPRKFCPERSTPAYSPKKCSPPTLFRFVSRFARIRIGDSSRNRCASAAYFAWEGNFQGENFRSPLPHT